MTLCITTLWISILMIMSFRIMIHKIMTFRITTLGIMVLSITTLSIIKLSITKLSISVNGGVTLCYSECSNSVSRLSVIMPSVVALFREPFISLSLGLLVQSSRMFFFYILYFDHN